MKKRVCITTVVSADYYQYFIPIFTYSILKAYPNYRVKIFLRGLINSDIIKFIPDNATVVQNCYLDYPQKVSTTNSLRFLVPKEEFNDFDYVYITDVDFIYFKCDPSHENYYSDVIEKTGFPCAAIRGQVKNKIRRKIIGSDWIGSYARILGGGFMVETSSWFDRTHKAVDYYREILKSGNHDSYDKIPSASYREYDEVMLARICRMSNIRIPERKNRFVTNKKVGQKYRGIHLGDFKFPKRWTNQKIMDNHIHNRSVDDFRRLEKDNKWMKMCDFACRDKAIKEMIGNVRKYIKDSNV